MRVPALPGHETAEIVFPTWAPGSYLVRDFVRHVIGLTVTDARGRTLARERLDKQRWRIQTGGRAFRRALPRVRVRGERAHVVPRRQPRLLERHQHLLLRRGRAGAPLPRDRGAAAALGLARGDRAAAGGPRAQQLRGGRLRRAGRRAVRDRHARDARVQGRADASSSWRCTAAATPTPRAWSTSCAASSPRRGGCSAASRSTATCSSCTRCRSDRAASSTARR